VSVENALATSSMAGAAASDGGTPTKAAGGGFGNAVASAGGASGSSSGAGASGSNAKGGGNTNNSNSKGSKRGPTTVTAVFRASLDELMARMKRCRPHFIRCLKPNLLKKAHIYSL
jgi:hypothetical protein